MNIKTALPVFLMALFFHAASAQEYTSPTRAVQTGRSPGVKVKLISADGQQYVIKKKNRYASFSYVLLVGVNMDVLLNSQVIPGNLCIIVCWTLRVF